LHVFPIPSFASFLASAFPATVDRRRAHPAHQSFIPPKFHHSPPLLAASVLGIRSQNYPIQKNMAPNFTLFSRMLYVAFSFWTQTLQNLAVVCLPGVPCHAPLPAFE
jgi:hypothetical protein